MKLDQIYSHDKYSDARNAPKSNSCQNFFPPEIWVIGPPELSVGDQRDTCTVPLIGIFGDCDPLVF